MNGINSHEDIYLTGEEYESLKNWAGASELEQAGIITANRDGKKVFPKQFLLDDRFVKSATSQSVTADENEITNEIIKGEYQLFFLSHTHPGKEMGKYFKSSKHGTGISVGDIMNSHAWDKQIGRRNTEEPNNVIYMCIASAEEATFWRPDWETGAMHQLGVYVDDKKLNQPDIIKLEYGEIKREGLFETIIGFLAIALGSLVTITDKIINATQPAGLNENIAQILAMLPQSVLDILENLANAPGSGGLYAALGFVLLAFRNKSPKEGRDVIKKAYKSRFPKFTKKKQGEILNK